jgi:lipopolysaccharide export system protein LptA
VAAAFLAGGALAQTGSAARSGPTPADTSNAPIDITANEQEVLQPQRLIIYRGNVEAIQNQTRMRSPELRITYRERQSGPKKPANGGDQQGSIERIEALGPFYYVDSGHDQIAKSDHAVWLADADTITLTGHVILTQEKDVTTGDKLVINRRTGEHKLSMNNPGGPNGRVRAIIFPKQNPNAPAQGGARAAGPGAAAARP